MNCRSQCQHYAPIAFEVSLAKKRFSKSANQIQKSEPLCHCLALNLHFCLLFGIELTNSPSVAASAGNQNRALKTANKETPHAWRSKTNKHTVQESKHVWIDIKMEPIMGHHRAYFTELYRKRDENDYNRQCRKGNNRHLLHNQRCSLGKWLACINALTWTHF